MKMALTLATALLLSTQIHADVKRKVGISSLTLDQKKYGYTLQFKARVDKNKSITCDLIRKGKAYKRQTVYARKKGYTTLRGAGDAPSKIRCYYFI